MEDEIVSDLLLYDTTLRDGAQTEGISFSADDKAKIARKLDQLGVHYIEGGFSHPSIRTDMEFFARMREEPLENAKLVVFGMTRRAGTKAEEDPGVRNLVELGAPVAALVAKTWDLHVTHALRVELEENLAMIRDSIRFVKDHGVEVCLDAEHFFDGFKHNPDYALECLRTAAEAGADSICLCDTNGGMLPGQVQEAVRTVKAQMAVPLGIHAHNDCELGVANSLAGVKGGATHTQGTINGYGERVGNANLISIIPDLQLKMGYKCVDDKQLSQLTAISRYVDELANQVPNPHQPFVGHSAFAHKGGMHVHAVNRAASSYEHIAPNLVGNERRVLVSELSGRSNIVALTVKHNIQDDRELMDKILSQVVRMENQGYQASWICRYHEPSHPAGEIFRR